MLRTFVLFGMLTACASATTAAWEPPRRAPYKPGESIAAARLCACEECVDRGCCEGEPETTSRTDGELGMTLGACGRCSRRVWTVRGDASCSSLAAPECCPGTVSD